MVAFTLIGIMWEHGLLQRIPIFMGMAFLMIPTMFGSTTEVADFAMVTRQWTYERSAIIWCGP